MKSPSTVPLKCSFLLIWYYLYDYYYNFCFLLQVVLDSGALSLDKVFELIAEGEKLPVYLEKELKVTYLVAVKPNASHFHQLFIFLDWCSH